MLGLVERERMRLAKRERKGHCWKKKKKEKKRGSMGLMGLGLTGLIILLRN